MLSDEYLFYGLDALCRAHETDYFADGHRGAAIIAAYFLCREAELEDGAAALIGAIIDAHWAHTDLCAPFPSAEIATSGAAAPALIGQVLETLEHSMGHLRQAGHNVILPSLALRAFEHAPETVTPTRVAGICKLIEAFTISEDFEPKDEDIPDLGSAPEAAEFILSELPRTIEAFYGRGQGWSGHLLTYGRALLDLRQMGYGALARRGEYAFKRYIQRIRLGPLETDKPRPEHPQSELHPLQRAYWQGRRYRPVGIGHVFKYPYGFYGLMDLTRDTGLKRRCEQVAYHIF